MSVVVIMLAVSLQWRGTGTNGSSPSNSSKLELLRGLELDTLNELLHDELPRWVKFPDVEKCEWLNKVATKIWPHAKVLLARSMKEALEQELELVKPTVGMTELGICSLNVGTAAPTINGIKCLESIDEDVVTVDVDLLAVTQNSEIIMSLSNPLLHLAMNVELSDVVLRGTLRFVLKPLFPWWPTFGAVAVSFMERPMIDFQLKTLHVNFMELPTLSPIIHKVINSSLERCCLWPNKVLIPIVDEQSMLDMESLVVNHFLGVLVIRELRVNGVYPRRSFSRWSGVYNFCLHYSVGKENVTTSAVRGQNSFKFAGRMYQLLVFDPQSLDLNVVLEYSEALQPRKQFDAAWIRLDHLKPRVDCTEHVSFGCDGVRSAEFEVSWYPFTRRVTSSQEDQVPLPHDVARTGVVSIKLLRCERLASMDINGTSDPYVVFSVGCRSNQSSVKQHTLNPIWDPPESFEFLVSDYQQDELLVVVMDSDLLKHDDTIGRVQIALAPVQRALRFSDTWPLEGNCSSVALEGGSDLELLKGKHDCIHLSRDTVALR